MCDGKEVTYSFERKSPRAEAPLSSQLHRGFQLFVNWLFLEVSVKVLLKPTTHFLLNGAISSWESDIKSYNESEYLTHIHLTSLSSLKQPLLARRLLLKLYACTQTHRFLHWFPALQSQPSFLAFFVAFFVKCLLSDFFHTSKLSTPPPQPIECHV